MGVWNFWIDVGGTFTDCLARSPEGTIRPLKVLSSGITKGRIQQSTRTSVVDETRFNEPENFWIGYEFRLVEQSGRVVEQRRVIGFDSHSGTLQLDEPLSSEAVGWRYELASGEEAPILAIRHFLGLQIDAPIPPVVVKLGTTRGTNALLTRTGARTALVTNRGFADVLRIGNQDRPKLFDLNVKRLEPLYGRVAEIDGRLDTWGEIVTPLDESNIRRQLEQLRAEGTEAVAICLMNAFANSQHEERVAAIARSLDFVDVTVSSEVAPRIKFVPRGDTTVVDAYLNPVLAGYVRRLNQSLRGQTDPSHTPSGNSGTQLRIMSSAGGLLDAHRFTGKDSILSGPAGGVVGFAQVAERAGFASAIGFDMGGTSTDVSRFDGTFDLEFEATKAGVRLATPMLAIETVAAGGGSICQFDGVKLAVGPQSAGASPGPACYGRGGPLTVTDVNLLLGRILEDRFPFPLDREAVVRRLDELRNAVANSPIGRAYSTAELAEGFRAIAIEAMARAIRAVSVAKGFDPADDLLVTFGGAGGQHACELADVLGMRTVLSHRYAGVLSAYGIGMAIVRRFGERTVLREMSRELEPLISETYVELIEEVRQEVTRDGVAPDQIHAPRRLLDLRYVGTDSPLTVEWAGDVTATTRAFTTLYQQQFGYDRPNRAIECVTLRVEVAGGTPPTDDCSPENSGEEPSPAGSTMAIFEGKERQVPVYERDHLTPGNRLVGPAIIYETTSTFVLDPGWEAEITAGGDLIARRQSDNNPAQASQSTGDHEQADPIRLELFNNHFASIAEQMGEVLRKTSLSTNVKERLDYSCAIFDAEGNLVVNAPHIPVHLGAMGETVRAVLADPQGLSPGDVVVTNDPYRGGSHLPDVTVVTPVHDPAGKLLFLTASRAHHAEIGGIVPGSMPPFSRNLAEEGVLIRNLKLIDAGTSREQVLEALLKSGKYPSRSVGDNLADIAAQVAANRRGAQLLGELVRQFSLPVVVAYMGHIRRAAAEKVRMALRRMPEGKRTFEDFLDDGAPIRVTIALRGDSAHIDFTGTGPVLASNLNANRAIVTAAVLYVFRCLIDEEIPLNGGVLDPVTIHLPTCLLNPPAHDDPSQCAAIVGGNVETSQRVVDVLLGALGLAAASQGTMNNLTFGNERFGYYETICGGTGATATASGCSGIHSHMTNTRLTDPEVLERRYPVRLESFRLRAGSGGRGEHTGGDGIVRELRFLEPLSVAMLSERRGPHPPFGLDGGEPGQLGRNSLSTGGGEQQDLGGKFRIDVAPNDLLIIETPGGGGYGSP